MLSKYKQINGRLVYCVVVVSKNMLCSSSVYYPYRYRKPMMIRFSFIQRQLPYGVLYLVQEASTRLASE